MRSRSTIRVLALLLSASVVSSAVASPKPTKRKAGETSPGVLSSLIVGDTETAAGIRYLARVDSPLVTETLLSHPALSDADASPRLRLELIRALHDRVTGKERERIISAAFRLLQPVAGGHSANGGKDATTEPSGQMRSWVRATAAQALAQSRHPRALRGLFVLAARGGEEDPVGSEMARAALASLELSPGERAMIRATLGDEVLHAALSVKDSPAPETPLALAALGAQETTPRAFCDALLTLAKRGKVPESFSSPKEQRVALKQHPAWALRALASLSGIFAIPLREFAVKEARTRLSEKDPQVRSAAAWTLAVLSPKEAVPQLESADPVVVEATLRQAFSAELARPLLARRPPLLSTRTQKGKDRDERAQELALLAPDLWSTLSLPDIYAFEGQGRTGAWLGPLASLFTDNAPQPGLQELRGYLDSGASSEKSRLAEGLARSSARSATGLLLQAYSEESDEAVRRSLARALVLRGLPHAERQRAAELEVDALSRRMLQGKALPPETRLLLGFSSAKVVDLKDAFGTSLTVVPAPDGFVGVVMRER